VTTPLLSVVIPTWNRAQLVCEAVDSALSQRPGEVEVIVVDDASTDDTAGVLARRFGFRVHLLRLPERRGPGAARNVGALMASGEFLSFLDSDDVWLPGKLDAELSVLASFPNADAVVSDSQDFLEGQTNHRSRFAQNGLLAATQGQVSWVSECEWLWTNSMNTVATSSMTLHRRVLANMGETLFAEDLACCEDWEFQMRIYHRRRVVVLPKIWTWVRRFADGTRLGRAVSGKPRTPEQEVGLLRDRLTVMGRSHWLNELDAHLAVELERFRSDTTSQLAQFAGSKQDGNPLMT
jgi:glycosyltransferase involved in cell wall biosynthesis